MSIKFPFGVKRIAELLKSGGFDAYAVGGCVRDSVMGKLPSDFDMTTSASPEEMQKLFDSAGIHTIPTGIKHGTLTVRIDKESFEVTAFRVDGEYSDSRRPDSVTFTRSLEEDLKRRDFTVNAMAADPLCEDGGIVDLFGGQKDIKDRVIRAVGDPETRFFEDALRILRAVRFATVLDFEIEKNTLDAAKKLSPRLSAVSAERKSEELKKILLSPHADRGVSLLFDADIAKYIYEKLTSPCVLLSTLPVNFATRLSALLFNSGSTDVSGMKLSGEITKTVKLLCDKEIYSSALSFSEDIRVRARMMISKYQEYASSACLLRGDKELALKIDEERKSSPATKQRELDISGGELLSLGIEPKRIGDIMNSLLLEVIRDTEINKKEQLIRAALLLNERGKNGTVQKNDNA